MAGSSERITLKILLVGDSNVGKTCLWKQFTTGRFAGAESEATIGVDFQEHHMTVGGKEVKLTIWDTAGQERYRALGASYYRGSQGIILAYDVTRPETFASLESWLTEVDLHSTSRNVVKMLVGNKIDLESDRKVQRKQGEEFARSHAMLFVESSAKTSEGVQDAFEELVQKILDTPSLLGPPKLKATSLDQAPADDSYGCAC